MAGKEGAEVSDPHVAIRNLRKELGMTQAQLAKRAGMPQSHLAKIEAGKVDFQLSTLRRIFRAMYCEPVLVPRLQEKLQRIRELIRSEEKNRPMSLRIVDKEDPRADLQFWLGKSPEERIEAVEFLRQQCHLVTGQKTLPRLVRSIQVRDRHA